MDDLRNYKAIISFSHIPVIRSIVGMEDVYEAAQDYLARVITDFDGFGVTDTYKPIEFYVARDTILVTFKITFATAYRSDLDCIADSHTDLGAV